MKNFREATIEAAKAMKVTPRELGYEPEIVYETDPRLIQLVKDIIKVCDADIDNGTLRDCVPEEYWKDLGIEEEKYKVVEVTLTKTIYAKVKVAVPVKEYEDDEEGSIYDAIGDTSYLDTDDEDEWEIDSYDEEYGEKTYSQLCDRADLWNESEFD